MTIETGIDLSFCMLGQKVKLRDGSIGTYNGLIDENAIYVHAVDGYSYINNGKFWVDDDRISTKDVVEIFPLDKPEQPKPDTHPSVAWWESCPWITDRLPTVDDTPQGNTDKGMVLVDRYYGIAHKHYINVTMNERWIHVCTWEPHNQTPKQKALALIAKHKDSSTVGVWIPTLDDWIIIREGLAE